MLHSVDSAPAYCWRGGITYFHIHQNEGLLISDSGLEFIFSKDLVISSRDCCCFLF